MYLLLDKKNKSVNKKSMISLKENFIKIGFKVKLKSNYKKVIRLQ